MNRVPVVYPLLAGLALIAASFAAPLRAQEPSIQPEQVKCVPNRANGLITATVQPEIGGAEVRLYFRWDGHGDFYYVVMEASGGGTYWVTPPKPTDENRRIEYYVAVVEPKEPEGPDEAEGQVVGNPSPHLTAPVEEDCDVDLDEKELGMADNLIVGETKDEQRGNPVLGFLCDGIISRIGRDGILRADEICRRCIVAWWDRPRALVPAAVLLGGGTTVTRTEASPSRP